MWQVSCVEVGRLQINRTLSSFSFVFKLTCSPRTGWKPSSERQIKWNLCHIAAFQSGPSAGLRLSNLERCTKWHGRKALIEFVPNKHERTMMLYVYDHTQNDSTDSLMTFAPYCSILQMIRCHLSHGILLHGGEVDLVLDLQ